MNMRGDNLVKKRGKGKHYLRGMRPRMEGSDLRLFDFSWGSGEKPKTLIPPFPCKCVFCNHPHYRRVPK